MESIYDTLKNIIEKFINDDEIILNKETPLADILDSMDILDIMFEVEDKFNIKISDEDIPSLENLADVAQIVEKHIMERDSNDD